MSDPTTREHIVEAADRLFYQQGYEHTSFADIAGVVKISRGNFYFHFKTKDEILDAVINRRLAEKRQMLERWEIEGERPADRIRSFINIILVNRADLKRYGCPLGTLSTELAKLNHPAQPEATELFTLFRTWLRRQFELLGRKADADRLAMHLFVCCLGFVFFASSFHDDGFIRREVEQMYAWLDACVEGNSSDRAETVIRKKAKTARRRPLL